MKTILVATDFSGASENAALYAADLAGELDARLILMHVNIPQESFQQAAVAEKYQSAVENAERQLQEIKSAMQLRNTTTSEIETYLVTGDFFLELFKLCEKINPYMVIMGSQGSTATERFLMGSNSVHAARNLSWPLITVPTGASYSPIRKVGLASDFDEQVTNLPLSKIETLLSDFNATLHVINVGKKDEFSDRTMFEAESFKKALKDREIEYHFIQNDQAGEGIMQCAEQNALDLLMVFPRQYGFLEQLFHKSMSKQLVLNSRIPVMALHPAN